MLISDSGEEKGGGESLIGDNGLSGQQFFSLLSYVIFVIAFSIGVLVAYLWRKRVIGGKMRLWRYQELIKKYLQVATLFAVWSVFWLYSLITTDLPLGLVGIPSNSPFQLFYLMFTLFLGWPLLALGLGMKIGSLIFPVKKPSASLSSQ